MHSATDKELNERAVAFSSGGMMKLNIWYHHISKKFGKLYYVEHDNVTLAVNDQGDIVTCLVEVPCGDFCGMFCQDFLGESKGIGFASVKKKPWGLSMYVEVFPRFRKVSRDELFETLLNY